MCMFCRSFFVLFLLAIVLSVILRYTDSDYPFGIFKLFLSISWQEQITFRWDEVHFVLKKHDDLDFHWAYSLKQQSMDRHIAPLGHIILNPSPPVFALTPSCCVLYSRKTANTKFLVTWPGSNPQFTPLEVNTTTPTGAVSIVWPDRVRIHDLLHSKWTPLHPLVQSHNIQTGTVIKIQFQQINLTEAQFITYSQEWNIKQDRYLVQFVIFYT